METNVKSLDSKFSKKKIKLFETEADLCKVFISAVPDEWIAYPETGGFDILLVRKEDGFQIGIEAKLKLNTKVVLQAAQSKETYHTLKEGPDCRAILIPANENGELLEICKLLQLTPITCLRYKQSWQRSLFSPELPKNSSNRYDEDFWFELCPYKRIELPYCVPDVCCGVPSPVRLTKWKERAIKLSILLEKRGFLSRKDFSVLQVSMPRWTQCGWLRNTNNGWVNYQMPDFKAQHPKNYAEIEADFETWSVVFDGYKKDNK